MACFKHIPDENNLDICPTFIFEHFTQGESIGDAYNNDHVQNSYFKFEDLYFENNMYHIYSSPIVLVDILR